MNRNDAPGWRQLCLDAARPKPSALGATPDIEREIDAVSIWPSNTGLRHFELDEFREFLRAEGATDVPALGFGAVLRQELWWSLVCGLGAGTGRIPQA